MNMRATLAVTAALLAALLAGCVNQQKAAQRRDAAIYNTELGIARLIAEHGMAPGKAFESWFDEVLEARPSRRSRSRRRTDMPRNGR